MAHENSYTVTGMTCGHCAASVTEEVEEIAGVRPKILPTRKDLIESGVEYSNRDADMQVFLADVQQTPPDTFGTSFSPAFSATSTEMTKVLAAVLAGQQDPAQAVAAFRKGAEKSLQDAAG